MLDKIKIEGYKSIKGLELELSSINIFIGSNGVGKSNFISFFKLVNNIYEQRLKQYSLKNGADNLLHYGRKETEKIHGLLKFGDNAYSFILEPNNDGGLFISEEKSIYHPAQNSTAFGNNDIQESKIKYISV